MEYMGNEEFWNNKFENRKDSPLNPEKSLIENIMYFKKGSVLDVACGDGRNTLFLLKNGFKVKGVDFSFKAIERLNIFAKRENYLVDTKLIDLSDLNSLNEVGVFDNILINHYRLSKDQLDVIASHISDGGTLFICGFGHKYKVDSKIRKDDLIYPDDFEDINKLFELVKYIECEDDRGFFVTYIFRKLKK
ncbi:class I SAM-dependent methyltransferase [Romboutsia lituseburensis]|uniref:class I SAM-dependent methyltransferase n=1 Tax=Romboutsia lituseburensis TaxID=1537 RepID=UPI00215AB1AE|nr:methyltransferase domain-containing protein [Romboutsia lituseburensis]MCR8747196.1 methyltransferase domain-containing protein [Romboutsia lituseburensis]